MKKILSTYTGIIISINVIVYFLYHILSSFIDAEKIIVFTALTPTLFVGSYFIWTLLTSMFLHTYLLVHLLPNMITLFFFGKFTEPLIGRKRFLKVYLLSGIMAGILHLIISLIMGTNLNLPAMGASGAILGLVGLLAGLIPKQKVLLFFVIPIPLWGLGILLFALMLFNPQFGGLAIGHVAHFGGFATGLIYGIYLNRKFPDRIKMIRRVYH